MLIREFRVRTVCLNMVNGNCIKVDLKHRFVSSLVILETDMKLAFLDPIKIWHDWQHEMLELTLKFKRLINSNNRSEFFWNFQSFLMLELGKIEDKSRINWLCNICAPDFLLALP